VPLGDATWLDVHFEASRRSYQAMLESVGFLPGWRVLDAGCGAGSHLELLADAVFPDGSVEAFDIDPDHVAALRGRPEVSDLVSDLRVADITDLPYPAGHFHAAWCANVTQYLEPSEMERALLELRRVTRPGGLVAVKDVDMGRARIAPGDPELLPRLCRACEAAGARPESSGSLRGSRLADWLTAAGFTQVRQAVQVIHHRAPLSPPEGELVRSWLPFLAGLPEVSSLSQEDRAAWAAMADPHRADSPINDPGFCLTECQVLAVGRVPRG
jgi:SAM-dependent methyltransferase